MSRRFFLETHGRIAVLCDPRTGEELFRGFVRPAPGERREKGILLFRDSLSGKRVALRKCATLGRPPLVEVV